ncbi:hypothetical protein GCM10010869_34180 [Mesorhizobium tianshanense]|nr:hypothetical protein GCM10010869_34180 [Mesorhizobium tianshanense]
MALPATSDIQSGYTARTGLSATADGGVPAIQLRDVKDEGAFDPSGLPRYALSGSFDRYWAGAGDILFRSRGERNTATMIAPEAQGAAIAMLPLLILRPHRDIVEPAYLAWFINQPETQRYFDKCARGTRLRMIPKRCLDELEVPVPDLQTQLLIVEIDALARRERELAQRLSELKSEYLSFALLAHVRNAQRHDNETGRTGARR